MKFLLGEDVAPSREAGEIAERKIISLGKHLPVDTRSTEILIAFNVVQLLDYTLRSSTVVNVE